MKAAVPFALGMLCCLAASAMGAAAFIESGVYDIGADAHHSRLVSAMLETLRERSIGLRAGSIEAPRLEDPDRVAAGASRYSRLCVGCHLAPGVAKSDLRPGLYPHAPNLAQQDLRDARRAFWIIKHGIKMSAMPAWGKTLDDAAIWDLVSFLERMPAMTPEAYRQIAARDNNLT